MISPLHLGWVICYNLAMSNDQITIEPEGSDFYRPTERKKRGGLAALIIKLSGGRITETGASYFLLGFAVLVFIISIIILVASL
mgnify:CR=1 FL=1